MNKQHPSAEAFHDLLARVRSLAQRPRRDAEQCFWIEGVRSFVSACDAHFRFDQVVCSPILLKSPLTEMLVRRLSASGVRRWKISPEQFRALSAAQRASGIGAIVRQRWTPLEHAAGSQGLGWVVVESVRSPGNLGTILRTAEACGATGVIFAGGQPDPFDPAVVRACMGGIFSLPLVRTTAERLGRWAADHGVTLVGLSPQAKHLWTELPSGGPLALVLGEERSGLSSTMQRQCRAAVRLPMTGRADSLNVAVAAGVVLYELVRRSLRPTKTPETI